MASYAVMLNICNLVNKLLKRCPFRTFDTFTGLSIKRHKIPSNAVQELRVLRRKSRFHHDHHPEFFENEGKEGRK
jgi:hypothetical protein